MPIYTILQCLQLILNFVKHKIFQKMLFELLFEVLFYPFFIIFGRLNCEDKMIK